MARSRATNRGLRAGRPSASSGELEAAAQARGGVEPERASEPGASAEAEEEADEEGTETEAEAPPPEVVSAGATPGTWVDRGFYIAIEFPVVARHGKFPKVLPHLRSLGEFREFLLEGGGIVYRNLFGPDELQDAWKALALLKPWEGRLTIYVRGDPVSLPVARDLLWCSAFPRGERSCVPDPDRMSFRLGCGEAAVDLSPWRAFGSREGLRHLLSFACAAPGGRLQFDRQALLEHVERGTLASLCPAAPRALRRALARALPESVALRDILIGAWIAERVADPARAHVLGEKAAPDVLPFRVARGAAPVAGTPLLVRPIDDERIEAQDLAGQPLLRVTFPAAVIRAIFPEGAGGVRLAEVDRAPEGGGGHVLSLRGARRLEPAALTAGVPADFWTRYHLRPALFAPPPYSRFLQDVLRRATREAREEERGALSSRSFASVATQFDDLGSPEGAP